jgi:hypothetical protein
VGEFKIIEGKPDKGCKAIFYGPEGVGKTTLASKAPNPVFIDVEAGASTLGFRRMERPRSWEALEEQFGYAANGGGFSTIVIDTIDAMERLATEAVCSENGWASIEDAGYGKGYVRLYEKLGKFLNRLSDAAERGRINVILVCHSMIAKFEQPDELGQYDRWQLKLLQKNNASIMGMFKEWADLMLFVNYQTVVVNAGTSKDPRYKAQGGERVMYASHTAAWDAKNRYGLPDEMPLDWAQIAKCFADRRKEKPAPAPAPPATAQAAPSFEEILEIEGMPGFEDEPIAEEAAAEFAETEFTPELMAAIERYEQLLQANLDVSPVDVERAVTAKGYFPAGTPLWAYGADFIDGVLIGAWPKIKAYIEESRRGAAV